MSMDRFAISFSNLINSPFVTKADGHVHLESEPSRGFGDMQDCIEILGPHELRLSSSIHNLFPENSGVLNSNLIEEEIMSPRRKNITENTSKSRDRGLSFRKNSLKFCRRLSKSMLLSLQNEENLLFASIFTIFSKIIDTQIATQKAVIIDINAAAELHRRFLMKIWLQFKNIFSNYKNNKICLVTFREWQLVFSKEGFQDQFDMSANAKREITSAIEFQNPLDYQLFIGFYKNILFTLNKILLNVVIYEELLNDTDFLERNSNAGDFVMLANHPWLYRHYNHCKGKFALECCDRCKVCRATSLPVDYSEQLARIRENIATSKKKYTYLLQFKDNLEEFENQFIMIFSSTLTDW